MQLPKEDLMVEPCDICGARGWTETIVICSKCNINREHAYCMQINTLIIPKDWLCESCQSERVATSSCKVNQDIGMSTSKRKRAVKTGKVKFLHEDEVIRLSSGNITLKPIPANCTLPTTWKASVGSKNVISKIPSLTPKSIPCISPPKVLGKLPRNDGVHKQPKTNQHASCSLSKRPPEECIGENQQPLGGVIPGKKVQTREPQKEKPTEGAPFEALTARKYSPIVGSGGTPCADAECNQSYIEESDLQSIQENLNLHRKFLPSSIPTWRGQFQILHTAESSEFYDGFEALPPCIVNNKAYKFSSQMPSVLQLQLLPALNVLTDVFLDDSPKLQDIALYFFPSEHTERSRKNLYSMLKFMNAEKSMLRSYIDGVELLVFTSNQLDMDSRGVVAAVNTGYFLWGFFRQNKIERVPDLEPVDMDIDMIGGKDVVGRVDHVQNDKPKIVSTMEPVDMDIDMIGGKDVVGRVDQVRKDKPKSVSLMEYYNKLNVPPGFEAFAKMS